MDIKELIVNLLEFNLDAEVEVGINSEVEEGDFEFRFEEFGRDSLTLVVDLKSYVLVDESEYEALNNQVEGLESEVEDLKDEIYSLESEYAELQEELGDD